MNAFIIDVPDSWSDKEHEDLYNLICRFSFMLIKDDGNPYKSRYAFITAHQYEDIDALRRDFDISNDVLNPNVGLDKLFIQSSIYFINSSEIVVITVPFGINLLTNAFVLSFVPL